MTRSDRMDVALATGADGVHLAEVVAEPAAAAQYLTLGYVFPTSSKPGAPPHGPAEKAAVDVSVLASAAKYRQPGGYPRHRLRWNRRDHGSTRNAGAVTRAWRR